MRNSNALFTNVTFVLFGGFLPLFGAFIVLNCFDEKVPETFRLSARPIDLHCFAFEHGVVANNVHFRQSTEHSLVVVLKTSTV